MAAVSAWAKPGAWALAAEEQDAAAVETHQLSASTAEKESADFPSLTAAAVAAKAPKKKKKAQTLSLAEFNSPSSAAPGRGRGPTPDELLVLPTGPRERSAEELERANYRGFGLSYGGRRADDSGFRGGFRGSDEPRRSGFAGDSGRDQGPSRAEEVDDWTATKKTTSPESRERRSGGFLDSQSRADESDSWISNKGTRNDGYDGHRERRMGFDRNGSSGDAGVDSEFWGRKKVEELPIGDGTRRRLVLQPRSIPLDNTNVGQQKGGEPAAEEKKSKGLNPFGSARPREEVLAEKGQDWKKIDEKLEATKIKEATASPEKASPVKRTGTGTVMTSLPEDRTERAWRKPVATEPSPPRADTIEEKSE